MTDTTPEGIGSREVERRLILPCFKWTHRTFALHQGKSLDFDSDLTGPPGPIRRPILSSFPLSRTALGHVLHCTSPRRPLLVPAQARR